MATINDLSTELLEQILSQVLVYNEAPCGGRQPAIPPPFRCAYTTICRRWQPYFERQIFHWCSINDTDLEYFSGICVGRRRAAVSKLDFRVVLPADTEEECTRAETDERQSKATQIYSDAIHNLFNMLKSWEPDRQSAIFNTRTLELTFSLSDPYSADHLPILRGNNLFEEWYKTSYIELLRPKELPMLSWITHLNCYLGDSLNLHASVLPEIASRLPNLESIESRCNDGVRLYPELRQKLRHEFAKSLASTTLPALTYLELCYACLTPDHPNLMPMRANHCSSPSVDYLSIGLRKLIQSPNMAYVEISGPIVISPSFFWPENPDDSTQIWPNLDMFQIEFNTCTPDGEYYFKQHPDYRGLDDEEVEEELRQVDDTPWPTRRFNRRVPDNEKLLPLLKAMARAAACMPKLREMSLHAGDGTTFQLDFCVAGHPLLPYNDPQDDLDQYRLYIMTTDWRPDEELLDLFRKSIPKDKVGVGLDVIYSDLDF